MKLAWERFEHNNRLILIARLDGLPIGNLRDDDLIPVQAWCVKTKCGIRISFDMFRFNNEKEMATFLLKWS